MISSESRMREIRTSGLMSGGEETWLRLRLRHRHRAKAAGNSYSLKPTTAGRASPRLYMLAVIADSVTAYLRYQEALRDLAPEIRRSRTPRSIEGPER